MTWPESSAAVPHPAAGWEARIVRARQLARAYPAAAQVLDFYAVLAGTQAALAAHGAAVREGATFHESLDVDAAAAALPELLSTIVRIAPAPLSAAAEEIRSAGADVRRDLVERYWTKREHDDPRRSFIAEALLQPFAEQAAARFRPTWDAAGQIAPERMACGACSGRPVVAALREEAHGARRSLICGFCLTESPAPRLACAACGETRFEKLAVYRADEIAATRIDACDSCSTYIKTIDLTKDATAVPIVDDLATLTLDLWARGQGLTRIRPNLLRL
jgi:FdhE protein